MFNLARKNIIILVCLMAAAGCRQVEDVVEETAVNALNNDQLTPQHRPARRFGAVITRKLTQFDNFLKFVHTISI